MNNIVQMTRGNISNSLIVDFSPRFKLNHWIEIPKLPLNLLINHVNDVQIYIIFVNHDLAQTYN